MAEDLGTFLIVGGGFFLLLMVIGWGFEKLEDRD